MKLLFTLLVLGYGKICNVAYADNRIYEVLSVSQIITDPASRPSGRFALDPRPHVNTNSLPKEERLDMCDKARNRIRQETGVRVWLWKNGEPERQQYYGIFGSDGKIEIVMAFRCPTRPRVILQVLENENGQETVIAIIKLPREPVTNEVSVDNIEYRLIRASNIYRATRNEVADNYDSNEDTDPDQLTEGEFLRMCVKALETYPDENITWKGGERGEDLQFYGIRGANVRKFEIVLAYRCPTTPRTFITVPRANHRTARFILETNEEKEIRYDEYVNRRVSQSRYRVDYKYELKVAQTIEEVTSSSSREIRMPDDVIESAITSAELPEGECLRLCREGLEVVRKKYRYDYKFRPIKEPGSEKYYIFHFENEDTESVDSFHVEAFKCPTRPDLYIHISVMSDRESLIWVIIQDRPAMYNVQPVDKIYEVWYAASTRQITDQIADITAIDTDEQLSESNRRRMCRKAKEELEGGADYSRGKQTGLSKLYIIEMTDDYKNTVHSTVVRAFMCPTEPRIYLEVELSEDSLTYSIRVLVKERHYSPAPRRGDISIGQRRTPAPHTSASQREDTLIGQMSAYRSAAGLSEFEK